MIPFKCALCIFRKLRGQEPCPHSAMDKLLMACIRRMSLDTFWNRSSSTVSANKDKIRQGLSLSKLLGLKGPYVPYGAMPFHDMFGYEVAVQIVMASRRPDKHSSSHTQYESVRKFRTVFSNHYKASPQANQILMTLGDDKGKTQRFVKDGCASYWYSRFAIGCKRRMGQDWRPNRAFSTALLVAYLRQIKFKIADAESMTELNQWIVIGTYSVVSYVISLRGRRGFSWI
jgi:hypothetical protein